ncbi:flavin-containing monooxygenase [Nocardioides hwasunensis]|uniref:NAD(P)/FAD-dependent oxidoreductase n=1 Tax=Nocardioides hwasunensis TaxID=397258 RepID=A0ABR8MLH9_9ACTN|nr:NAD(P)/FAD-dependent oxidoreductase [Nocardioides hwasunensis]MBD3915637.1 NAD(P)/FAD-dependent oxidoreductase [Nocardioides hwasunensis]
MTEPAGSRASEVDYLIIGAGVCGLYQLHQLLELGADVRVVDANSGLGGTWFMNRYPGCRFDSESYTYQYSFSPELLQEWSWKEKFSPQPETLSYLEHVAERFDLERHITFEARVASATWSEDEWRWHVGFEDGTVIRARFVLCAMGLLSVPTYPRVAGRGSFRGLETHTFDWPEDYDVTGKRVAVIGTGASGVQVITDVADKVESMVVLQRDANWCSPLGNAPISEDEMADLRSRYDEIFAWCRDTPAGFIHRPDRVLSTDVSREERLRHWEDLYANGQGASLYMGNYRDCIMEWGPNQELSEFVASKIRQRVADPEVAEMLIPKDHGFGTKRVAGESGFYEVFNQDNVELVDLMAHPILEITETGVRLDAGDGQVRDLELDVICYATGFDAVTGPFDRIDVTGVDGLKLKDHWRDGPLTTLGVQVSGFPNMFVLVGPQSGSATANFPRGIEDVVNWMTQTAAYIDEHRIGRFEGRPEAELQWLEHVREVNSLLLLSKTRSWFNGHNINLDRDESPRVMVYLGGAPRYRKILAEEAEQGYPSFVLSPVDELAAAGVSS